LYGLYKTLNTGAAARRGTVKANVAVTDSVGNRSRNSAPAMR